MLILLISGTAATAAENLWEGHGDIGRPSLAGSLAFDSTTGVHTLAGGGENMWFTNDACHFAWQRMSGDCSLMATPTWVTSGGNAHRKACVMIRQSLAPDAPYVDVAVHGDGLTSLQFRETAGGPTREIQASVKNPLRVGLLRQGQACVMLLPEAGNGALAPAGPAIRLAFTEPFYIGLAVCAHDDRARETARFAEVELRKIAGTKNSPVRHCALEVIPLASRDRRVVYHTTNHIEAPNWSRDGAFLLYNAGGRLWKIPVVGGQPEGLDTGAAVRCNNDHGFSPDGSRLAISDQSQGGKSLIYTLPATGGKPVLVTPKGPSYWHGWSPDGATLAYCAERNGEFDIYTIPAVGGEEKRLTTATGLDDGPDYSPDGKFIYFNSDRSGSMHIWRMRADGSEQEQLTRDEFNDWFPHPSPDGKWLVFVSYEKEVKGHPENQPVCLRLMPAGGGPIQVLTRLFGGQGTLNVPSWSPDGRQVAFVSYELIAP